MSESRRIDLRSSFRFVPKKYAAMKAGGRSRKEGKILSRCRNAAALKAAEELRAEKAAHCESKENMAKMVVELKVTTDRCQFLEEENPAKVTDLEKATMATKDTRSAMRAKKEVLREARDIAAGKPFMLRRKFGDPRYAPLDRLWSSEDRYMDLAASAADAAKYFQGQTNREVDQLFWR